MKDIDLKISVNGHKATSWPKVKIMFNDALLFDQEVCGNVTVEKTVRPLELNSISVIHYGKDNDTHVDQNGNITADRYCLLDGIWINNIYFGINFFSEHNISYRTKDGHNIITNYFGADGEFKFEFPYPLWKFWRTIQ